MVSARVAPPTQMDEMMNGMNTQMNVMMNEMCTKMNEMNEMN